KAAYQRVQPLILTAIARKQLAQPLFSVYLKNTVAGPGGTFTFGAIDTLNCGAVLAYVPLTKSEWYSFHTTEVSIDNFKLAPKRPWLAISDTGTSGIAGPQAIIDRIARKVGATWDAANQIYRVKCNAKSAPLTFKIGGKDYAIPREQLIVEFAPGQCYYNVFGFPAGEGPDFILGTPFIRTFCQVYDIGQNRIGFAPAR
ncbi:Protein ASP-6, partial [Aphelenchoides avenae]